MHDVGPILQTFASGTSMHGVPKVIQTKSTFGKAFWSVICVAAFAVFFYHFVITIQTFLSYPKKVTIEVVPLDTHFPSVSVCNMRNLDPVKLNRMNAIFNTKNVSSAGEWLNKTDDPYIEAYMALAAKYVTQYGQMEYEDFQWILSKSSIAANIMERTNKQVLEDAGVAFNEFIVQCSFAKKKCNLVEDFEHLFDSYYYNCFTYTVPEVFLGDHVLAEGVDNGLSLVAFTGVGLLDRNPDARLIPGSHEYLNPMAGSEGVRIVIHPKDTTPRPHTEGFDVPPGYSANFGVKARRNIRVGPPHGVCTDHNPFSGHDDKPYRMITCTQHCLQQAVVDKCNCKEMSLPGYAHYNDIRFCADTSEVPDDCWKETTAMCYDGINATQSRTSCSFDTQYSVQRNTSELSACGCIPACNETSFEVSYSLSRWPGDNIDGDQVFANMIEKGDFLSRIQQTSSPEKFQLLDNYFHMENRSKSLRDLVRLNVYIIDSNVVKVEESPQMTLSDLFAAIGGQVGLWIGMSVITFAEVLELIIDLSRFWHKSRQRNANKTHYEKGEPLKNMV